jgi:alpha/beta hydrolase fold
MPAAEASLGRLEPLRTVRAGVLDIAYYEAGPAGGDVALLLHGYPYDIHSYVEVIPLLTGAGLRVIVPYLRGHGPTRFVDPAEPRSGQQAASGVDVIDLMDALGIGQAILAGYDWGGRAACAAAALWPERCTGLVSVNAYLIQDISAATNPIQPDLEAGFWYFFYFATERGRRGLTANRRDIAKVIWTRNSPQWHFGDAMLDRAAALSTTTTTSTSSSTLTGTGSAWPPDTRATRTSSSGSRPSRRSPCPPSRSTARPTGTSRRPTGPPQRRTSLARASTARSLVPGTTFRRKPPDRLPKPCLTWPTRTGRASWRPPRRRQCGLRAPLPRSRRSGAHGPAASR